MSKRVVSIFLLLFISVNFLLGFFGVASVLLTASFYMLLGLMLGKAVHLLVADANKKANLRLFINTFLWSMFIVEILLKYVFQTHLTYSEKNGDFFYTSEYKKYIFENLGRKYRLKQQDLQLRIHKPNTAEVMGSMEFSYEHQFNSLGLRGHEPLIDSAFLNIVGLGDSFTEGVGTPQDSTWLVLFEDHLNSNFQNKKIQCINGGSNGNDPFYEYVILERLLMKYRPRIVLLAVNSSDINDVIVRGGTERFTSDGGVVYNKGPVWEFFYQFSFIFRNLAHSIYHLDWQLLTDAQREEQTRTALSKIKNCIEGEYIRLSQKMGFQLVVVLHPRQNELEQNQFPLQPLYDSLQMDTTFTTINLFDEFKKVKTATNIEYSSLFWQMDLHNNSRGYQLWANILFENLAPQIHKITSQAVN